MRTRRLARPARRANGRIDLADLASPAGVTVLDIAVGTEAVRSDASTPEMRLVVEDHVMVDVPIPVVDSLEILERIAWEDRIESNHRSFRARVFVNPGYSPPFEGPITPPTPDYVAAAVRTALDSHADGNRGAYPSHDGGFVRLDLTPAGFLHRTEVLDTGEVISRVISDPVITDEDRASNAAPFVNDWGTPPFYGPITPPTREFVARVFEVARASPMCINIDPVGDVGFTRVDVRSDGMTYRTDVNDAGEVYSRRILHDGPPPTVGTASRARVDAIVRICFPGESPPFSGPLGPLTAAVRDVALAAARASATCVSSDVDGDGGFCRVDRMPTGEVYHTMVSPEGEVTTTVYVAPAPVPTPVHVPTAGELAEKFRDVEYTPDDRQLLRLACRIADLANAKFAMTVPSDPGLVTAFDSLLDGMEKARKGIRLWQAFRARGRRLEPYRETLVHSAISALTGRVKPAVAAIVDRQLPPDRSRFTRADPREVHDQLLAIRDEFGGITVNYRKKTISILTPDVVIPLTHPKYGDYGDESVNFGRFRISFPYEEMAGLTPPADTFRADALTPIVPKGEEYSSVRITHPHVMQGCICLGTAFDPLVAALGRPNLHEAFLIVNTVIVTFGSHAHPYRSPWRWRYTENENVRRLSPPPRSAPVPSTSEGRSGTAGTYIDSTGNTRCVACTFLWPYNCICIEEEEEDEEEEECDRCELSLSDCRCRECNNCGGMYDPEGGGETCRNCLQNYCDNCMHECSCSDCSNRRCRSCLEPCATCSNRRVCENCLSRCGCCKDQVCTECSYYCDNCSHTTCGNCSMTCEHCDESLCNTCNGEHGSECDSCEERFCDKILIACPGCKARICEGCSVEPEGSTVHVCRGCVVECVACSREYGRHEIVLDGLCPPCFQRELRVHRVQRAEARIRSDLRASRDEMLLVGLFPELGESRRPAAVAHREGAGRRAALLPRQVELWDRHGPGEGPGDVDLAEDRQGGPACRRDGVGPRMDEGWRRPDQEVLESGPAERRVVRVSVDGRTCERLWYEGLPLFNIDAPRPDEAP
jgi:hypothetical protein